MQTLFAFFHRMTLIEKLILFVVVAIVAIIVLGGGAPAASPEQRCTLYGGVPILNDHNRLIRCDFPVNVNVGR